MLDEAFFLFLFIDEWYQAAVKAGLNDIREEYKKQLQDFLDYKYGNQ